MLKNIIMNGIPMQEESSMTILDVARKHGVDIPTLCFIKRDDCNFTHKPASCRVCVVEIKGRRNLMPACATYIEEGMEISTNSYKYVATCKFPETIFPCMFQILINIIG